MKKYLDGLKQGLGIATIFLILFVGYFITKATLLTANTGDKLTATKWNEVINEVNSLRTTINTLNSIPAGSIVAFNVSTCPTGWNEYTPAYGRFLRGIDKSGTNIDPDCASRNGGCIIGSTQDDVFKEHNHVLASVRLNTVAGAGIGAAFPYSSGPGRGNTSSNGGNETRPKNVAVLYCVKN